MLYEDARNRELKILDEGKMNKDLPFCREITSR
jgi:hypothetical protein